MRENYTTPTFVAHPPLTDVTGATSDDSDRNRKANFTPVEGQEVLERLAQVPVSEWNYKRDKPSVRHIGPMAQDFRAAFGVGKNDKTIYSLDANGVAFAAIQGLYELVQAKDNQLAEQQQQIEALEARLAALEQRGAHR